MKLKSKTQLLSDRLDRLNSLQSLFYTQDGCSCGGPLHVQLDDGNLRDSDMVFAYTTLHGEALEHVRSLGLAILHELMFLSPAQRFLWWHASSVKEIEDAEGKNLELMEEGYKIV